MEPTSTPDPAERRRGGPPSEAPDTPDTSDAQDHAGERDRRAAVPPREPLPPEEHRPGEVDVQERTGEDLG